MSSMRKRQGLAIASMTHAAAAPAEDGAVAPAASRASTDRGAK